MVRGTVQWVVNTSSDNVSNTDNTQKKDSLLTIFVLLLVSDTFLQDQAPCKLDGQRHHLHLHHHQPSSRAMITLDVRLNRVELAQILTCFSNLNFRIVLTRSFPIIIPVCLPTVELNSIRWVFKVQRLSFPGGEWMYMMLTEVYGRRFRVDQPSQTKLIFEFIPWIDASVNKLIEKMKRNTYFNQRNRNAVQFLDFGIHCICHARFLWNIFIVDVRVQVRDKPSHS